MRLSLVLTDDRIDWLDTAAQHKPDEVGCELLALIQEIQESDLANIS